MNVQIKHNPSGRGKGWKCKQRAPRGENCQKCGTYNGEGK